jgi:hypothetical protein
MGLSGEEEGLIGLIHLLVDFTLQTSLCCMLGYVRPLDDLAPIVWPEPMSIDKMLTKENEVNKRCISSNKSNIC